MLFYCIPIHMKGWHGQHEHGERFPGYPHHPLQFVFDRLSHFASIHWWKQDCCDKVWRKIEHHLNSDFLSLSALDQLDEKAIHMIREASDYNGNYSVLYRCSNGTILTEFLEMFIHPGEILEFASETGYSDQVRAVERLLSSYGPNQFFIAISHDVWFAGIFADEEFLAETKRKHDEIVKKLRESGTH